MEIITNLFCKKHWRAINQSLVKSLTRIKWESSDKGQSKNKSQERKTGERTAHQSTHSILTP